MIGLPADTPVTTPVVEPTVANPVLLLLQVPPPVISLNIVVEPVQTLAVPVMAAGNGLTVMIAVVIQPVASV